MEHFQIFWVCINVENEKTKNAEAQSIKGEKSQGTEKG